jgi:hypothetical protein
MRGLHIVPIFSILSEIDCATPLEVSKANEKRVSPAYQVKMAMISQGNHSAAPDAGRRLADCGGGVPPLVMLAYG